MVAESIVIVFATFVCSYRIYSSKFLVFFQKERQIMNTAIFYLAIIQERLGEENMVETPPLSLIAISAQCPVSALCILGNLYHRMLCQHKERAIVGIIVEIACDKDFWHLEILHE